MNLALSSFECLTNFFCDKNEFKKQSNFFEFFLDEFLKEPIDLNLIMLWNFFGLKLSNSIGFSLTSLFFLFFNILILILTYNISYEIKDPETSNYSFPKIILLFVNWILMAIFFGGSTLLAQYKLIELVSFLDEFESTDNETQQEQSKNNSLMNIDSEIEIKNINLNDEDKNMHEEVQIKLEKEKNENNIDKIKKQNEKNKIRNFKALFLFSLAIIIGYSGKYGIAYIFTNYKRNNIMIKNESIFNNTKDNLNYLNGLNSNFTDIPSIDEDEIYSHNYNLHQNIFFYIHLIYAGCIIISIIYYLLLKYCFFTKTKKEEKKSCCSCDCCLFNLICEVSGCIIYSERININEGRNKPGCCCLCCETMFNCCNNIICNLCNCRKNSNNNLCCCCKYSEIDFEKDKQCFCYCYQEKSICYWINKYFINDTQKIIVSCVILYFLAKLSIIGCQGSHKKILRGGNILDDTLAFYYSLGLVFIVSSTVYYFSRSRSSENPDNDSDCNDLFYMSTKKLEPNLFQLIFCFFFVVIFGLEYSFEYVLEGYKIYGPNFFDLDKTFIEKFHFYLTIIINAYFSLLLNYYCIIKSKSRKGFEILLTQTMLLSLYLLISDYLIDEIIYVFDDIDNLFILQLVVTMTLGFIFAIIVLRPLFLILIIIFDACFRISLNANCIKIICCVSLCRRINQLLFY